PTSAPAEIYTPSLHDALPISGRPRDPDAVGGDVGPRPPGQARPGEARGAGPRAGRRRPELGDPGDRLSVPAPPPPGPAHPVPRPDRKSTRLNSSHRTISYAVF